MPSLDEAIQVLKYYLLDCVQKPLKERARVLGYCSCCTSTSGASSTEVRQTNSVALGSWVLNYVDCSLSCFSCAEGGCLLTKEEMVTRFQGVGIPHCSWCPGPCKLAHAMEKQSVLKKDSKPQFMVCPAVSGKLLQKSTFHLFAACWWCQEKNFCSQVNFSVPEHNSRKRKCWW